MWRHNLSPMQWQQSVICFIECGSACRLRDRLGQPSLRSAITVVCVSLIQESNCSRKQATSAKAPYPSLILQNVMISCTGNEFDFRLMYRPTGLWLISILWGLLGHKSFRRDKHKLCFSLQNEHHQIPAATKTPTHNELRTRRPMC